MLDVELNDVVEFVIAHEKDHSVAKNIHTLHPMHLHGHAYAIVGIGQVSKIIIN
jgi:FtsP/CotA-like multicopper oxidase with cupredoxin domain